MDEWFRDSSGALLCVQCAGKERVCFDGVGPLYDVSFEVDEGLWRGN
jgi:hypothetical protein